MSWHWENFITLHRQELEHVFEQKDLGDILDAEIKFDENILVKVKKANAIAGLICRTFSYLDGPLFKKLFTTFIRPLLDTTFEKIKLFWKMCNTEQQNWWMVFITWAKYSKRLKKLNLPLLVYRRAWGDMTEIFKHFHSYDNCTLPENFRPRNRPSRKHNYQLVWRAPKDGLRRLQANFFYFRTIKTWNELPKEIVHATSIDSFKNKLDEAWKDLPIKF